MKRLGTATQHHDAHLTMPFRLMCEQAPISCMEKSNDVWVRSTSLAQQAVTTIIVSKICLHPQMNWRHRFGESLLQAFYNASGLAFFSSRLAFL